MTRAHRLWIRRRQRLARRLDRPHLARYPWRIDVEDDEPVGRPCLPEEARILLLLRATATAADAVRQRHGDGCDCYVCRHMAGLAYNLDTALAGLESELGCPADDAPCPCCGRA